MVDAPHRRLLFYGPIARSVRAGSAFLSRAGFQVIVAEKASQLIDGAARARPELCVLAYDTPDVPGDEIVLQVRLSLGPRSPAFLLVCGDSDEEVARCEASGAAAVLRAPWTREELLQTAARIIGIPPRTSRRVLVGIDVKPTTRDRELLFGTLANISTGGTLLQTNEILDDGTKVGLSFTLPGQSHVINCTGVIVRREESEGGYHGYGVRFDQLLGDDVKAIEEFVEAN